MERSLVLIKPDGVARRETGVRVLKALRALPDAHLLAFRETVVPESLARLHYAEHEGKPFYPGLLAMITSRPGVIVLVLEGPGMIQKVRSALGPTMVEKAKAAEPACLRAQYGVMAGINVTHASDAPATGLRETNLWSAALGLEYNEAAADAAFDAYVAKYEGQCPFLGADVQRLAAELKAAAAALRAALEKEAADPADASAIFRLCANNI